MYALIISFEIHVLVLISAAGQLGSRAGPRSMAGFELVELVRVGSKGVDARVTQEETAFDKVTPDLKPVKKPSPPPAIKREHSKSPRPAKDRQRKQKKNQRTSNKARLEPARPDGPEPTMPEVSEEEKPEEESLPEAGTQDSDNASEPEFSAATCAACPPPTYPSMAQRRRLEGVVVLKFQVLPDGSVGDIFVDKSSGYSVLDEAAMEGIKDWTFYPATKNDRPVAVTIERDVVFKMEAK